MYCVVLFHRDLRLTDNTAFLAAAKSSYKIIPVFIFPPEQIDPTTNQYFSHPAVQFLCDSLKDLDTQLQSLGSRLYMFKGDTVTVLKHIHAKVPYHRLYQNQDYTVYAKQRDEKVATFCSKQEIAFENTEDYDLVGIKEGLLYDGRPYTVLSQYFNKFQKELHVRSVDKRKVKGDQLVGHIDNLYQQIDLDALYKHNTGVERGGRTEGLKRLRLLRDMKAYTNTRDYPAINGTTRLSAHLKFGTISVREVYNVVKQLYGPAHGIIRELVFRSFYIKIYIHRPELQRGTAYRDYLDKNIVWKTQKTGKKEWTAWVTGTTGFPLCDAGMRQLLHEGWVHNRVRMLVASVPTRYLFLDWRDTSRYFYQHLVDCDTISNTAGWQWASGVGPDAAPYFRAPMNPFIQSKKFDTEAEYIRRYIPELSKVKAEHIHRWDEEKIRKLYPTVDYPAPIIGQKEASKRSSAAFKAAYFKS